jgi:hypothetical protein
MGGTIELTKIYRSAVADAEPRGRMQEAVEALRMLIEKIVPTQGHCDEIYINGGAIRKSTLALESAELIAGGGGLSLINKSTFASSATLIRDM